MEDGQVIVLVQEITRKHLFAKALIQDIQENVEEDQELEATHREVQKSIHEIRTRIDELERIAKEQEKETDKVKVLDEAKNHRQLLTSLQASLKKANLTTQIALEKKARQALLEGSPESALKQRGKKDKESLTKMSSEVTDSLLTLSRNLMSRVEQSEDSLQILAGTTQTVTDTQEEFKSMGGVIHQSRKLLSKYNRREFTDKVLIFLALAFFFACVLYVMKKRIF